MPNRCPAWTVWQIIQFVSQIFVCVAITLDATRNLYVLGVVLFILFVVPVVLCILVHSRESSLCSIRASRCSLCQEKC